MYAATYAKLNSRDYSLLNKTQLAEEIRSRPGGAKSMLHSVLYLKLVQIIKNGPVNQFENSLVLYFSGFLRYNRIYMAKEMDRALQVWQYASNMRNSMTVGSLFGNYDTPPDVFAAVQSSALGAAAKS